MSSPHRERYAIKVLLSDKVGDILDEVNLTLHTFIRDDIHKGLVTSLVLHTKTKLQLDEGTIEQVNCSQTQKERIEKLISAVRAHNSLVSTAIKDFLEILVNFKKNRALANRIRININASFSNIVKVVRVSKNGRQVDDCTISLLGLDNTSKSTNSVKRKKRISKVLCFLALAILLPIAIVIMLFKLDVLNFQAIILLISQIFGQTNSSSSSTAQRALVPNSSENGTIPDGISDVIPTSTPTVLITEANSNDAFDLSTTVAEETSASFYTSEAPTVRRSKFKAKVDSYDSYEEWVNTIPSNRILLVSIYLRFFSDWPFGANMTNAGHIESLSLGGYFLLDILLQMWSQTINLNRITLIDKVNELCSWNEGKGISLLREIQGVVHMNATKILTLKNFNSSSCEDIYLTLGEKTIMPNLQGLAIRNGLIDSKNIHLIQRLFRRNWNTLTHLRIQDTKVTTSKPFFGVDAGVWTKMEHVILDNLSMFVGSRFCSVIPNVRTLESAKGYLAEENLSYLFTCRHLETLHLPIKVRRDNSYFNITFLSENYPQLKKTVLWLYHDECDDPTKTVWEKVLRLEGMESLKWPDFTVISNCRLILHTFCVPDKERRKETRFEKGKLFGLSYNIEEKFR